MTHIQHKFAAGQVVEAFDRNGTRAWRRAYIANLEPYIGRPGYYIRWDFGGRRVEQWESTGGWKPEYDVRDTTEGPREVPQSPDGVARALAGDQAVR